MNETYILPTGDMVMQLYEDIAAMECAIADPFTMVSIAATCTAFYPNSVDNSREQKINEYLDTLGVNGNDHSRLHELINKASQTLIELLQRSGVNIHPGMDVRVIQWLGYDAAIRIRGWTST